MASCCSCEAVRVGAEVRRYPDRMRPPGGIRAHGRERDVGALATRLHLHSVYVPSMRNGRLFPSDAREDRGNAILSTWPLDDLRAIELPFGRQRHVGVAARVMVPGLPPLRVMTVHLDPAAIAPRKPWPSRAISAPPARRRSWAAI
jgi:endonuclease/exonuclease/phosphatase family metal-dependent hydrolase